MHNEYTRETRLVNSRPGRRRSLGWVAHQSDQMQQTSRFGWDRRAMPCGHTTQHNARNGRSQAFIFSEGERVGVVCGAGWTGGDWFSSSGSEGLLVAKGSMLLAAPARRCLCRLLGGCACSPAHSFSPVSAQQAAPLAAARAGQGLAAGGGVRVVLRVSKAMEGRVGGLGGSAHFTLEGWSYASGE